MTRLARFMIAGVALLGVGCDGASLGDLMPTQGSSFEPGVVSSQPATQAEAGYAAATPMLLDPGVLATVAGSEPGLQHNGAVVMTTASVAMVELSAPLFPMVETLYAHEDEAYPAELGAQQELAQQALLTYDRLLVECEELGYDVALELGGDKERLARNYNEVARCSYEQKTAKPYLIPQLIADVDVCAAKLGDGWRLPKESEVMEWPAALFEQLSVVLDETVAAAGDAGQWGSLYFSPAIFVHGDDGRLRYASLYPDALVRVADLPAEVELRRHLEAVPVANGDAFEWAPPVVRCVRSW